MKTHLDEELPQTLVQLLSRRADALGRKRAISFLVDGQEQEAALSFSELETAARSVAHALSTVAKPGDRAILLYPPGIDFAIGFFGCVYAGLIAVPAFPPDPQRLAPSVARLAAVIADAKPAVVLTTAAIADKSKALAQVAPILAEARWLSTENLVPAPAAWRTPTVAPQSLALLQYTSGSTASPKGVMTTHQNVLANLYQLYRSFPPREDSHAVLWIPMFHNFGLIAGVLQPLFGGFPTTFLSPLHFLEKPRRWLEAVTRLRATTTGGPDFGYELCARAIPPEARRGLDLSNLDVAGSGGEPVRSATLAHFANAFGPCGFKPSAFKPCYGLSEATLLASSNADQTAPRLLSLDAADLKAHRVTVSAARESVTTPDSVTPDQATAPDRVTLVSNGRTLEGQRVAIVDPGTCRELGADHVGEIWLGGPNIATGYWGKPNETSHTFGAALVEHPGERYLRTGDLGFLHDDELYVTGRIKDLIIVRGQNHYPQDIEHSVEQSHPLVRPFGAAAFSVEANGEEILVVTVEIGPLPTESFDFEPLAHCIRERIAAQHGLEAYALCFLAPGSLPKTPSAKVMRSACRKAFLAGELAPLFESRLATSVAPEAKPPETLELSAASTSERHSRILALVVDELARLTKQRPESLGPKSAVNALGLDSLNIVELRASIETRTGVAVPLDVLLESVSLTALTEWLDRAHSRRARGEHEEASTQQIPVAELALDARFELPPGWNASPSGHLDVVLLTGATGFTGAYLLSELLQRTRSEIRCLVRARTEREAHDKLASNLARYGLRLEEQVLGRITAVLGDLSLPAFGLDAAAFDTLAQEVGAVVHGGAWVNFLYPYSSLKASNVEGTRTVLQLATTGPTKAVHFLSTLGVLMTSAQAAVTQGDAERLPHLGTLPNGYEQSKWVADQMCAEARALGVPVYTYRLGLVTGESTSGAYVKLDEFFPCMLKGCLQLGSAPRLQGVSMLVPVDYASRAIVHLLQTRAATPQTLVLNHPTPLALESLNDWMRERGHALESLPYETWRERLFALPRAELQANALYPFLDYLRGLDESQLRITELDSPNAAANFSELSCLPLASVLEGYFDCFKRVGFLSDALRTTRQTPASRV